MVDCWEDSSSVWENLVGRCESYCCWHSLGCCTSATPRRLSNGQNKPASFLNRKMVHGEDLYAFGHPNGLPYCIKKGIFSAYRSPSDFLPKTVMSISLWIPRRRFGHCPRRGPFMTIERLYCRVIVANLDTIDSSEGAKCSLAVPVCPDLKRLIEFAKTKKEEDDIFFK